jgi:hypothetical protein
MLLLLCADEFQGDTLNTSNWTPSNNYTNNGWLEIYMAENVYVTNDTLVLETKYQPSFYGSTP